MRRLRSRLLLAALAALTPSAPAALGAQGTIRGVLTDSLLSGRPVSGAEIVLLGGRGKTVTDAAGRFDFEGLAAGTYTVAYWAPWLDSLGLPALQREIEVRASGSVIAMLGTPSAATYQRATCGTLLEPGQGILIGEIRDTSGMPVAGVGVNARWTETLIGQGQLERRVVASADTSNASGMYSLCGLPVGSEVALRAIGAARTISGEIIVSIAAAVQRRDLGIAPPTARARVVGRVTGPGGGPIASATVAIAGDTSRIARTGEDGSFVLDSVPRRSTQLIARALGYVPFLANVELMDAEVDVDAIGLQRIPQELEAVMVRGESMTAGRLEFETRKTRGMGFFVDDATIAKMPIVTATAVAALIPRTTIRQTRNGPMLMLRRGSEFCNPRFYVDGYDNADLSAEEQGWLFNRAKRVEVYTANMAPAKYNDFDGCGAVVVWTR